MRHKNFDLIAASGAAVFTLALTLLPVHLKILQLIIALPLIFVWPGYLLTELLFQKRATKTIQHPSFAFLTGMARQLNALEHLTLALGLSVVIDIVGGFLLNWLPIGLTPTSWAALLGILTIVLVLGITAQRFRRRNQVLQENTTQVPRLRLSFGQMVLFGLAGVVLVLSLLFSVNSAQQQPSSGFTQFWVLLPKQHESSCAVQLGIRNFERTSVTYRVTMKVNGISSETWAPITLAPQQEWNLLVPVPLDSVKKLTNTTEIEAQLYRTDNPATVYRQVHTLLPPLRKSQDGKILLCGTS